GQQGVTQALANYPTSPGARVAREILLDVPNLDKSTRLDIGQLASDRELILDEVKNGTGARLTQNQRACIPEILKGNFIPRGARPAALGLDVGKLGGGASSVSVRITNLGGANVKLPLAGAAALILAAPDIGQAAASVPYLSPTPNDIGRAVLPAVL